MKVLGKFLVLSVLLVIGQAGAYSPSDVVRFVQSGSCSSGDLSDLDITKLTFGQVFKQAYGEEPTYSVEVPLVKFIEDAFALFSTPPQLTGCILSGANLKGINLEGAIFASCTAQSTNFEDVNLKNAQINGNFTGANFLKSNLTGAVLDGTFDNATFVNQYQVDENANLTQAKLQGSFKSVNFQTAYWPGADTSGVTAW